MERIMVLYFVGSTVLPGSRKGDTSAKNADWRSGILLLALGPGLRVTNVCLNTQLQLNT